MRLVLDMCAGGLAGVTIATMIELVSAVWFGLRFSARAAHTSRARWDRFVSLTTTRFRRRFKVLILPGRRS